MAFQFTQVEVEGFPSPKAAEGACHLFGLSLEGLKNWFGRYTCPVPLRSGPRAGYQQVIARELAQSLEMWLAGQPLVTTAPRLYSPNLREVADLAFAHPATSGRLFVEIEFRPNFEKDLVKFQIGSNKGTLALAILIVALKWSEINPKYHTMPEYGKIVRTLRELQPTYPLLLLGFTGKHLTATEPSSNITPKI